MADRSVGAKRKGSKGFLRKGLFALEVIYGKVGIYIYAIAWLFTIILGYIGFQKYYQLWEHSVSTTDLLFDVFRLFVLRSGDVDWSRGYVWELDVARMVAILVFYWSVALIVSKAFVESLHRLRLWLCTDHVIVCGKGPIGSRFIKALSMDRQVVVVEKAQGISKADEDVKGTNIVHLQGNATDEKVLRRAGIARARHLVPALEDESVNAEIAISARKLVKDRSRDPLTCFLHVQDPDIQEVLRVNEFNLWNPSYHLEFYNVFDIGARTILNEYPAFQEGGESPGSTARILIVGLDEVGQGIALWAAKRWWPHYQTTNQRPALVLVDEDANTIMETMLARHPALGRACTLEPIAMNVTKLKFTKNEALDWLTSKHPTSVYVCAPNDTEALSVALALRKRLGDARAPIVVRMDADSKPATLMSEEGRDAGLSNIHTFGFWDRTCTKALIDNGSREILGQAIHEMYCLEQQATGSITQASRTSWDGLSEELRESNRAQADHMIVKAKAIGCRVDTLRDWGSDLYRLSPYEVHKIARMEHDRWCEEKSRKGWKYGKVRNDAKRIHDDLCPWEELTSEAKYKDIATVMKIPRTLARVDLQLVKKDLSQEVAKALLAHRLEGGAPGTEVSEVDALIAWRDLPDSLREGYRDEARAMMACIESIGCGLSGRGAVKEEVSSLSAEEAERATIEFRELMSETVASGAADDASKWPAILAKEGLAIFRRDQAKALLTADRESMLTAFTERELEDPFARVER